MTNLPTFFAPSYVHGANDEPLLGLTIRQALEHAAATWADQVAALLTTGVAMRRI
jgi:hypothetical protein